MNHGNATRAYAILGLPPGAAWWRVRWQYRKLARRFHPDRASRDPAARRLTEEKMKEINEAYRVLVQLRRGGLLPDEAVPSRGREPADKPRPDTGRRPEWSGDLVIPDDLMPNHPRPPALVWALAAGFPVLAVVTFASLAFSRHEVVIGSAVLWVIFLIGLTARVRQLQRQLLEKPRFQGPSLWMLARLLYEDRETPEGVVYQALFRDVFEVFRRLGLVPRLDRLKVSVSGITHHRRTGSVFYPWTRVSHFSYGGDSLDPSAPYMVLEAESGDRPPPVVRLPCPLGLSSAEVVDTLSRKKAEARAASQSQETNEG